MLQNVSALSFIKIWGQMSNGMAIIALTKRDSLRCPQTLLRCRRPTPCYLLNGRFSNSYPLSLDTNYYSTRGADQFSRFQNFLFKTSDHYDLLFCWAHLNLRPFPLPLTISRNTSVAAAVNRILLNRFHIFPRSPPKCFKHQQPAPKPRTLK